MLKIIRDLILVTLLIFAIYFFATVEKFNSTYWPEEIKIRDVIMVSTDSIIDQADTALIPVNYIGTVDFRTIDPELRKGLFIQYLLPAIVITRERLLDDLHHVQFIEARIFNNKSIASDDSTFLVEMKLKYETDSLAELKKRVYPHPVSLALSQAILESGWGTSGIFRNGNNIFGIMSFSSDESRYKVRFPDGGVMGYIRTYRSVIASIEDYYLVFSKVSSYKKFRQKRWNGAQSTELLHYIGSYHESGQYINMAHSIIETNGLERYDNVAIAPKYLEVPTFWAYLIKY